METNKTMQIQTTTKSDDLVCEEVLIGLDRPKQTTNSLMLFEPLDDSRQSVYESESESSDVIELDETPGNERLRIWHSAGTSIEGITALDKVELRRLILELKRMIAEAATYTLFEFNDKFTRSAFIGIVHPVLEDARKRNAINQFKVVCDETNNQPEVIDRNEFVADIYIKPTKSVEYVTLNFVATRSNVAFDKIVGHF